MSELNDERRRMVDAYDADPLAVNRTVIEKYRANGANGANVGQPFRRPPGDAAAHDYGCQGRQTPPGADDVLP